MLLTQKEIASSVVDYSPITEALAQANINEITKPKLKRKFSMAYMIAKENLSFTKMKSIVSWRKDMEQMWEQAINITFLVQLLLNLLLVNS